MRYWNLAAVNDSLAKENARLKMKMPNSQYNNLITAGNIEDTFYFQQYKYTEAQIINNSVNKITSPSTEVNYMELKPTVVC
jgi:rod shape-determining protein MreC